MIIISQIIIEFEFIGMAHCNGIKRIMIGNSAK